MATDSPSARSPFISVVIPTHGSHQQLETCISAVQAAPYPRKEIIVVDDSGATDGVIQSVPGIVVVPNHRSKGPAGARNAGAEIAQGEILLFVDSDCEIAANVLDRVATVLADGGPEAVFGIESDLMQHTNFASEYRNLWMRYALSALPPDPGHIHTSCAAIRTATFRTLGSFDESQTLLEDSELGHRLASRGGRILRDEQLVFAHHKHYQLRTLLETECSRGSAVVTWHLRQLFTRDKGPDVVFTVPRTHAVGLVLFGAALAVLSLTLALGSWWAGGLGIGMVAASVALRGQFLMYIKRERGWSFFVRALLFTIPDYTWVLWGAILAVLRFGHAALKTQTWWQNKTPAT